MNNGDKPAYPTQYMNTSTGNVEASEGLTIRQRFAMAAMQGIIAGHPDQIHNQTQGVTLAVRWADELLKQLES